MPNKSRSVFVIPRRLIVVLALAGILGGFFGAISVSSRWQTVTPAVIPDQAIIQKEIDRYFDSLDIHPLQYTITAIESPTPETLKVIIAAAWPTMEEDHVEERQETLYLEKTQTSWTVQEDLSLN